MPPAKAWVCANVPITVASAANVANGPVIPVVAAVAGPGPAVVAVRDHHVPVKATDLVKDAVPVNTPLRPPQLMSVVVGQLHPVRLVPRPVAVAALVAQAVVSPVVRPPVVAVVVVVAAAVPALKVPSVVPVALAGVIGGPRSSAVKSSTRWKHRSSPVSGLSPATVRQFGCHVVLH
jgi:hypothetical protein